MSLSAVTGENVRVANIRKNRPSPGLKAQHVKAIETAALLCDANVAGLSIGSTDITFSPLELKGGKYDIDIGTAGSISLLLQCVMPVAVCASDDIELTITGGTDVAWSPPTDYLKHVTSRALSKMGYKCDIDLLTRGYYPKGGGRVRAHLKPSGLKGFDFTAKSREDKRKIYGISHCANLPEHVAERQADSAAKLIMDAGYECDITTECVTCRSTGSGIGLWHDLLGANALGKRGLPAEKVGRNAAKEMIKELHSGACVDVHLSDQLIPYMGLCRSGFGSYTVRELSQHTLTNIWVTEQFLDVKFDVKKIVDLDLDQGFGSGLVEVSVR